MPAEQKFQVHWRMTGKLEVMASCEEEADEIVCGDYSPEDIVEQSKDVEWESKYITRAIAVKEPL